MENETVQSNLMHTCEDYHMGGDIGYHVCYHVGYPVGYPYGLLHVFSFGVVVRAGRCNIWRCE